MQLAQEQAHAHGDVALDLGLAGGRGHEMTAGLAFMESDTANMDLLSLQRPREPNRVGRDASHQVGSGAVAADRRFAGSSFRWHERLRTRQAATPAATLHWVDRDRSAQPATNTKTGFPG